MGADGQKLENCELTLYNQRTLAAYHTNNAPNEIQSILPENQCKENTKKQTKAKAQKPSEKNQKGIISNNGKHKSKVESPVHESSQLNEVFNASKSDIGVESPERGQKHKKTKLQNSTANCNLTEVDLEQKKTKKKQKIDQLDVSNIEQVDCDEVQLKEEALEPEQLGEKISKKSKKQKHAALKSTDIQYNNKDIQRSESNKEIKKQEQAKQEETPKMRQKRVLPIEITPQQHEDSDVLIISPSLRQSSLQKRNYELYSQNSPIKCQQHNLDADQLTDFEKTQMQNLQYIHVQTKKQKDTVETSYIKQTPKRPAASKFVSQTFSNSFVMRSPRPDLQ